MSIKFRSDGAVFPTQVENGILRIGNDLLHLDVEVPYIKGTYKYDCTDFPISNIMCYLKNDETTICLRFDGTKTLYRTWDKMVIGFGKYDYDGLISQIQRVPLGMARREGKNPSGNFVPYNVETTIYKFGADSPYFALECLEDPEPILFIPQENPQYFEAVIRGNRNSPYLEQYGENLYREYRGSFEIHGVPIKLTGSDII